MLWGLKRAMSGYLVMILFYFLSSSWSSDLILSLWHVLHVALSVYSTSNWKCSIQCENLNNLSLCHGSRKQLSWSINYTLYSPCISYMYNSPYLFFGESSDTGVVVSQNLNNLSLLLSAECRVAEWQGLRKPIHCPCILYCSQTWDPPDSPWLPFKQKILPFWPPPTLQVMCLDLERRFTFLLPLSCLLILGFLLPTPLKVAPPRPAILGWNHLNNSNPAGATLKSTLTNSWYSNRLHRRKEQQ